MSGNEEEAADAAEVYGTAFIEEMGEHLSNLSEVPGAYSDSEQVAEVYLGLAELEWWKEFPLDRKNRRETYDVLRHLMLPGCHHFYPTLSARSLPPTVEKAYSCFKLWLEARAGAYEMEVAALTAAAEASRATAQPAQQRNSSPPRNMVPRGGGGRNGAAAGIGQPAADLYREAPRQFDQQPSDVAMLAAALRDLGGGGGGGGGGRVKTSAIGKAQGPKLVAHCLGPSKSDNFKAWGTFVKQEGVLTIARNIRELQGLCQVLDCLVEEAGHDPYVAAAKNSFEVTARRIQALILLERNDAGEGHLLADAMMGDFTQSRLHIDADLMAELRHLGLTSAKVKREGGGKK